MEGLDALEKCELKFGNRVDEESSGEIQKLIKTLEDLRQRIEYYERNQENLDQNQGDQQ